MDAAVERLLHQYFRMLTRYNAWANARLYECCSQLDSGVYRTSADGTGRSILDVLNARLAQDKLWSSRLQGYVAESTTVEEDTHADFATLRDAQLGEDVGLTEHVDGLAEEDLLRPIAYEEDGEAHTNAQHELLTHLAAEQIGDRARVTQLIESAGAAAPDLAMLTFLRDAYVGIRTIKG